jgi:manganese-dependent inorganic pyrophosphatase
MAFFPLKIPDTDYSSAKIFKSSSRLAVPDMNVLDGFTWTAVQRQKKRELIMDNHSDLCLVVGHKNPDTDSICAAHAYADLKNTLAGRPVAKPVRCGHLPKQTTYIFQRAGVKPPEFVKNVYTTAADLMSGQPKTTHFGSPLAELMHLLDEEHIQTTPVVSRDNDYLGIVNINSITRMVLGTGHGRTRISFSSANIDQVLGGRMISRGKTDFLDLALMIGAMPQEGFKNRISELDPASSMLIIGERSELIRHAVAQGIAAIIVTGVAEGREILSSLQGYQGWAFASPHDTIETFRRISLSMPVKTVMDTAAKILAPDSSIDEAKRIFADHQQRGIPVVDKGKLVGMLTRTDFLKQQKKKLVLVDHNEISQAVDGAEDAEICEIIDHHRMGALKTSHPIHVYAKPVGSTCTLVHQLYQAAGVEPARPVALLLLSGILSDTLAMKSPTATIEDETALRQLSAKAGIDWQALAMEIFSNTDDLKSRKPIELVKADLKLYNEGGISMGIAQVEVVDMDEVGEARPGIMSALEVLRNEKALDWTMLLISDIIHSDSVLITSGLKAADNLFKYRKLEEGYFHLPGVLSRKKQLLPEVLRVVEELKKPR